ncbi:MAG TPA: sulfurtransferase TusA family protein [Candidatus Acidoferrum sp.]|nr:sulfurtransferase TusA family protein [Candidatus Acidoferrum sp.]
MTYTATLELDLTGLTCPMPLLKTKQALNKLATGDTVKVVATDPASMRDFQVFAEQSGNKLLESNQADGRYIYLLLKK